MAWTDQEISVEWTELKGEYKESVKTKSYTIKNGTALNLSDMAHKCWY